MVKIWGFLSLNAEKLLEFGIQKPIFWLILCHENQGQYLFYLSDSRSFFFSKSICLGHKPTLHLVPFLDMTFHPITPFRLTVRMDGRQTNRMQIYNNRVSQKILFMPFFNFTPPCSLIS